MCSFIGEQRGFRQPLVAEGEITAGGTNEYAGGTNEITAGGTNEIILITNICIYVGGIN